MKSLNWKYLLLAATFALVSIAGCSSQQDELVPPHDTFTIESIETNEPRTVNVYLPPDYDETQTLHYPVIYMPDGGVLEDFPHIATTIDTAIRAGEMQPVLLVGVENTERRRDMTGPTEVPEDREVAPVVGGSKAFRAFFSRELIPQIHQRYRVNGESGIIGESLAALFIVEIFILQPELFDKYIALSPSLWWNNEALVRQASEMLQANPDLQARLYLSSANEEDIAPQTGRLAEILERDAPEGLQWKYDPRPDLRHNNIYRTVSPAVLRQLYPNESMVKPSH